MTDHTPKREPMRTSMTLHQKIMRAAFNGTGMRLTRDEVWDLRADCAIEDAAISDCETTLHCDRCYRLKLRCICGRAR